MKAILFLALIVCSTFAVQLHHMSSNEIQKFDKIRGDKKWSSIVMNLVELHMLAQGPLDQLVNAINDLVDDLNAKLDRAYAEYDQRTTEHNAEVRRIQGEIDQARTDVAYTIEFLQNVLYVQRQVLQEDLVHLQQSIQNNQRYIEETTQMRELAHREFEERMTEHNEAIEAINEALGLLDQLKYGETSLVQIKKMKSSLDKVSKKITKGVETEFIKALLELSAEEFSDQGALAKVENLMLQIRQNLEESITSETAEEENAQTTFTADMSNKRAEINTWQLEITQKTNDLARTEEQIADNEAFLAQRQADQAQWEADLITENERFDRITANFEDLTAQLQSELDACNEALDILSSADIAGYIGGRMEQDVVIDQYHGSGMNVNDWTV